MADSNWQKVRVAFDDADGSRVEAVMWQDRDENVVYTHTGAYGPDLWFQWNYDFEGVTVTPIRELPTGVGAVIRVTDYGRHALRQEPGPHGDLWMLYADGWRFRGPHRGEPFESSEIESDGWRYEVLSEGVQIGDVK